MMINIRSPIIMIIMVIIWPARNVWVWTANDPSEQCRSCPALKLTFLKEKIDLVKSFGFYQFDFKTFDLYTKHPKHICHYHHPHPFEIWRLSAKHRRAETRFLTNLSFDPLDFTYLDIVIINVIIVIVIILLLFNLSSSHLGKPSFVKLNIFCEIIS